MIKSVMARDLSLLMAAKLAVLGIIYLALFAPFANQPENTAAHLLGAPPAAGSALHQTAPGGS